MSVPSDADKRRPATKLVAKQLKYVGAFRLASDDGNQVVLQFHDGFKTINQALLEGEAQRLVADLMMILGPE